MICYLIRHGRDDDTVRGGWSDSGLTSVGRAQAQALAETLSASPPNIDAIYSSDLARARETAEILAQALHLPVRLDARFREANNGALAGMKNDAANQKYPGLYWSSLAWNEPYPGGESPAQFFERIRQAWAEFQAAARQHPDRDVLLVTHGGVMEAILCIENAVAFSNKQKRFSTPYACPILIQIL